MILVIFLKPTAKFGRYSKPVKLSPKYMSIYTMYITFMNGLQTVNLALTAS